MAKIQSLLTQAAVIRDATSEGENTALRVGSMFVSLIQSIVDTLPQELLDATGISYSAGESNFIIKFPSIDDDGNSSSRQIIIPAASQDNAGLLTPAKLAEINRAVSDVAAALEKSIDAETNASSAIILANLAKDTADAALADSEKALIDAQASKAMVENLSGAVGSPDGIAPLDDNALIPARFLPAYVDDVIEFGGIVPFDISSLVKQQSVINPTKIIYASPLGAFVAVVISIGDSDIVQTSYYSNWGDSESYGNITMYGRVPLSGKIYLDTSTNKQYRWSGSSLVVTGSDLALGHTSQTAFPGNEGATLQTEMLAVQDLLPTKANVNDVENISANLSGVQILPFNGIFVPSSGGVNKQPPAQGVWWVPSEDGGYFFFQTSAYGYVVGDYNTTDAETGISAGLTDRIYRCGNKLYNVEDGELKQLGGASEGNCLNVTVELPKQDTTDPYYNLSTAIARIFEARRYKLGLQITFAATASSWKQYQYKGATLDAEDFMNEDNWFDMAGTSAGQEVLIDINALCGEPTAADYYSFASAVDALAALEANTKITYRKEGMVITYRISDSQWETLQLKRKVGDFGNRAAWEEFGGGTKVETKNEPASGGVDAFSTGGAYNYLPTQHEVVQEDGTVSIQLKNAAGEAVMEPITFLASTGGGGDVSGTVVSIKFEKSPLFGALGADIKTKAAIRSVTMSGTSEVDNAIATLEIIDRDTNLAIWSENVNRASSTSMEDFSFDIDFTPFFAQAGQRRFMIRVTDEGGYSATKYITVTAEDITVSVPESCVLHVRPDAMITPTMDKASVDLFAFYNNQSDKGIEAVVDILIDGEWVELHRSVVTDNFVKTISFSPAQLGLTHGAYPIRISGTSLNSGVTGNTVYSALMIVDPEATTPLVAIRYDDKTNGIVKLFESVSFDVAVYNPLSNNTIVNTKANDALISQLLCDNLHTYNVKKQIQGFAEGDVINLYAKVVSAIDLRDFRSYEIPITVSGSVIDATLKEGAIYAFDFSSRSNTEADHSIKDGDYELTLTGANYTTNGFVNYLGQNCLRIAENVKGTLNHAPFASPSLESSGMAWQCSFATNNIKDADAKLLECYDSTTGAGFYIKGNKVGICCRRGVQSVEERSFKCGEQITLGVTVEPSSIYVERSGVKYSAIRMYLNGELVAHIGYIPGRGDLFNAKNISMDGTLGDLYLYYALAYQSHYEWAQGFKNYLVKLVNTEAMIREFNAEDVLASQTAEGSTSMRPSAAALWDRGIPYVVLVADETTFDAFDNGTSTSDNFVMDVFYYDPKHPWRSFKATKCRIRRQGTTSAKRSKKNVRIYLSKASEIIPLFPDYTNEDALLTYALFAKKKIRVGENTMAIDLVTIKIDYSDAGGANDCGVCDMMNATYRTLGDDYMTPAQRFFDGTQDLGDIKLTGLELNHSTANHPIAVFRSTSDTLQNVYFEAKGNWKEDKGEQTALGFMNTPGYNLGCRNYQDESFVEYYGMPDETLDETEARLRAEATLDNSNIYLLSEYCGNRYRFMKHDGTDWNVMPGSMRQTSGKGTKSWRVSGYVLNPVTGFELLNYQGFCWWRGVPSVEDMMRTGTGLISSWVQKLIDKGQVTVDVVPQWTYYFECMVDSDSLAIAYATGKKVPFELYRMLRFCDSCDPDKYAGTYAEKWRQHLYKYLNVRSHMVYYTATDYNSLYDQQAKNMQPMFFLEDGAYIEDGVFYNTYGEADNCDVETNPAHALPERMYFNKVYDADGANGKDNDGGCTGDPECDPAKPTDASTGYTNPYAGWNSILWVVLRAVQEVLTDDAGNKIDLRTVVAAMRSVEAVVDGKNIKPFSPEGAMYFFLDKRLRTWPKVVSSYDGIRKYVQYTATADAIYFYALQGLGLTSLPDFIERRWRIRDGYYQTGAFFSNYISFRIACASDAVIRFTAAKTGYFGIGNDAPVASSETVYLEAGQSHEFTNFSHQDGALLFIFQADRMSALDLSEVSLSGNASISFTVMSLVTTLLLGSATHVERNSGYTPMSVPTLGNLPFLETLDIRNTGITTVDCSGCPRITKLDARGSALQSFSIAETSPINDIALPSSLTALKLVGLPNLTYTGLSALSGLRIPSLANIQTLRIETSPNLSARQMLCDTLDSQESSNVLSALRIGNMAMKGDASEILEVLERNVSGLSDGDERSAKPVVDGVYELTTILDQEVIDDIENRIEGITIHTIIDAFIELIDAINAEYYSGDSEVGTITLDNVGEHIIYYNGETYEEYLARTAVANRSIHEIITL